MILEALGENLAFAQIVGKRSQQEDEFAWYSDEEYLLLILADGMGGHAKGEVASAEVTASFMRYFPDSNLPYQNRLAFCLDKANERIKNLVENSDNNFSGMGSTSLSVVVADNTVHWISVGDSPFYRYRNKGLTQLNADHSMASVVDKMAEDGIISKESAKTNPMRNRLRSAVVGAPIELVDLAEEPLKSDDIYVLASDGLDTLSNDDIESIIRKNFKLEAAEIAQKLIDAINEAASEFQDNTTIIVLKS